LVFGCDNPAAVIRIRTQINCWRFAQLNALLLTAID
jgi:hypothetical protein